jgi:hypothetical protein
MVVSQDNRLMRNNSIVDKGTYHLFSLSYLYLDISTSAINILGTEMILYS